MTERFSELTKVTVYYCGRTSAHARSIPVLLTVHKSSNSTPLLHIRIAFSPAHDYPTKSPIREVRSELSCFLSYEIKPVWNPSDTELTERYIYVTDYLKSVGWSHFDATVVCTVRRPWNQSLVFNMLLYSLQFINQRMHI